MIVAFKPIGKRERAKLAQLGVRGVPAPEAAAFSGGRGSVVTLDGHIVLAFGLRGQVIYQDGSDAIPDLIRAHRRAMAALGRLDYDDLERIRRRGKPARTVEDILAGRSS